jgi:cytochrome c-type biogenesis protein CcmH
MFWSTLVVLCLLAVAFAVWPLWKQSHRLSPLVAAVIVLTVGLSAVVYDQLGSPGAESGRSGLGGGQGGQGMDEAIASLEARLDNNPDDIAGWKMLGRTHMTLQNYAGAVTAYERAMSLESGQVAQTLIDLALAIANRDQQPIVGRSAELVDNALALEPQNQAALFYGGMAAANRGDVTTAADHWEKLLSLNPPQNIQEILVQNIATWRGEAPPAPVQQTQVQQPQAQEIPDDAIISASVTLSNDALTAMPGNAAVFVIARDPAAPTPPIAVSRLALAELPTVVSLTDANSMVAGRNLSMFPEIELLARVSLSGGPAAASGDWYGSMIVRPAESRSVSLTIDQQVP